MRTPGELPEEVGEAFTVRGAHAAGVGAGRLRGRDLTTPFRGMRRRAAGRGAGEREKREVEADVIERAHDLASVMPERAFFVGPTAAVLMGLPLPRLPHEELHVAVPFPATPPRRPEVRGHRLQVFGVRGVRGLRVADPATTFVTLAAHLGEYDLAAAADYILRVPRGPGGYHQPRRTRAFATRDELTAMVDAVRWRGAARLRRAIERARTGASSRPETWTRLMLVDAGLPEPVLDHDIHTDAGMFVACADLAYPEHRVSIDYEGDGHRERRRFVYDINRFALLREHGWTAVRLTSEHVFAEPRDGVRLVRAALNR